MKLLQYIVLLLGTVGYQTAIGHGSSGKNEEASERHIVFPDTKEHRTMVADLHTHSVFSDGHVWPKIRVGEALKDGLQGLAITEHLEYQPHRADIAHPNRNRAYNEALEAAKDSGLLVIPGSEITRDMPAGHINAIFINDANQLINVEKEPNDSSDVIAYYEAAKKWPAQAAVEAAAAQGAFIFWNHPYWARQTPDGIARITDFHQKNAKNNLLHGIEIANGDTYSEEAFDIALRHDLALIGVSDVHELIDWDYEPHEGGHRPVTLIFTSDRSIDSMKEALFDRRTVVWFKNLLIGRKEHLLPLLEASISITSMKYLESTSLAQITIQNKSDAKFKLKNLSDFTFMETGDLIEIPPHKTIILTVKLPKKTASLSLPFEIMNSLVKPKRHAKITLKAALD
jgi:hypothetical protein